jgi:hypothetical protein
MFRPLKFHIQVSLVTHYDITGLLTQRRVQSGGIVSGSLFPAVTSNNSVGISESKFGLFTRLVEAPAYLICLREKEVATSLSLKGNFVIIKCISYSGMGRQMKGQFEVAHVRR